ncbi:MAG: site-specific integrase [Oligoflexales bacterium]|nr:site-specific integrase [Oligoflexales bacterium]
MSAPELIKEFKFYLRKMSCQPATIESYSRDALSLLNYLENYGLSYAQVHPAIFKDFEKYLHNQLHDKPNTIRRMIIGARQFFRFLVKQNYIEDSPLEYVVIPRREEDPSASLSSEQLTLCLELCRKQDICAKSTRDIAAFALLAFEGIKASELINIKWSDVTGLSDTSELSTSRSIFLTIHSSRKRSIALSSESIIALSEYRIFYNEMQKNYPEKLQANFMFVGFQGRGGTQILPRLSRHGLKYILYEIGNLVGLNHLNTEILRHTAIAKFVAQGESVENIMQRLGLRQAGNILKHLPKQDIQNAAT